MSQPPPIEYQGYGLVDRDTEHLKILSICWYVVSGLTALTGCLPFIHITVGIMMIAAPSGFAGGGAHPAPPPPAFVGWIIVAIAALVIALFWTIAILGFITARALPKRRKRTLCFVTAAIACLQIPFGITLGIFTLIVLARPSIKDSSS